MNGYIPTIGNSVSNFIYVYPRRKGSGLLYQLETTTNLMSNVWTNAGFNQVPTFGNIDSEFDSVTNALPTDPAQTFIRLKIGVAPALQ